MDSKTFRERATYAVDMVARFMEEFPEVSCQIRLGYAADLDIVVGLVERENETDDDEE